MELCLFYRTLLPAVFTHGNTIKLFVYTQFATKKIVSGIDQLNKNFKKKQGEKQLLFS